MEDKSALLEVRTQGARRLADHLMAEMTSGKLRKGMRLPPERELGELFGVSRGSVRRVLARFCDQGFISQRVGSGTFVLPKAESLSRSQEIIAATPTSPAELMVARLLIEPLMPGLIVQNATSADFKHMFQCLGQSEAATSIDEFEHWDEELHKAFAFATHNSFFVQLMDLTNKVREQGEWGRLKRISLTAETRQQYESQHRAIVDALKDRDAHLAKNLLFGHLQLIQRNLFGG